jgi:hypothetical protein
VTTPWTIETLARFFRVLDDADQHEGFWWRANEKEYEPFKILINCNDLFYWACADCEEVTPDTLDLFEQSIRDVHALHEQWGKAFSARHRDKTSTGPVEDDPPYVDTGLGLLLYCARVRKLRPQGAYYDAFPPAVAALFDAAGPEREKPGGAFGNTNRREWKGELDAEKGTPEDAKPWRCPSCRPATEFTRNGSKP